MRFRAVRSSSAHIVDRLRPSGGAGRPGSHARCCNGPPAPCAARRNALSIAESQRTHDRRDIRGRDTNNNGSAISAAQAATASRTDKASLFAGIRHKTAPKALATAIKAPCPMFADQRDQVRPDLRRSMAGRISARLAHSPSARPTATPSAPSQGKRPHMSRIEKMHWHAATSAGDASLLA